MKIGDIVETDGSWPALRRCKCDNAPYAMIEIGAGPHAARTSCVCCGCFIGWLPGYALSDGGIADDDMVIDEDDCG